MKETITTASPPALDATTIWGLFIQGQPVCDGDRETFPVVAPANGEIIARVTMATRQDLEDAVTGAHRAFLDWRRRTAYEREAIMRKATSHVRKQADAIALLMAREQGKPLQQARAEVISSCDTIDYYAAEAVRIEGYTNPTESPDLRSWVTYQPVGVCAVITPWNYPVSLLSWKLGPALATGCTVVVKPASVTPLSPTAFCMALVEGGLPPGTINVVHGRGAEVGEALIQHDLVKKVAMTGSSATGKRLMQIVGPSLKKISLELGGHCPAIVCADADLDKAAAIVAYKGFRNNGQSCSSINRVFVHHSVEQDFLEKLKACAEKMTIGDGVSDAKVDLGPMCTKDGLETCKEHVADALAKGAELITGGKAPFGTQYQNGFFYLPTVLHKVTPSMKVMQEETFGPLVPVMPFHDLSEAVEMANDTCYGLVSYLFARDFRTIVQVSESLEAGTVAVNTSAVNTNYAPYSGWKDSGYGMELGRRAVLEYLDVKHIKVSLI